MFELEGKHVGQFFVIKPLSPEITLANSAEFKAKCLEFISGSSLSILLDLSSVLRIDSDFVATLVAIGLKVIGEKGRRFALCSIQPQVKTVFYLTRIDQLFPVFATMEEAIEDLVQESPNVSFGLIYFGRNQSELEAIGKATENAVVYSVDSLPHFHALHCTVPVLALFIDEALVSVATIKEVRSKKQCEQAMIIVLTDRVQIGKEIRDYIKERGIHMVLQLPLSQEKLQALLTQIVQRSQRGGDGQSEIPNKLLEYYVGTIPGKIDQLDALFETLQRTKTEEAASALRDATHKIAGSAGTYGFIKVSELSRSLTVLIDEALQSRNLDEPFLAHVKDLLSSIRFYFDLFFVADSSQKRVAVAPVSSNDIFAVVQDLNFADTLFDAAKALHITLECVDDPRQAIDRLKSKTERPKIVILEQNYRQMPGGGLKLIEEMKQVFSTVLMQFWMAFDDYNLSDHIEALSKGVELEIRKPISLNQVTDLLKRAIGGEGVGSSKVLIVDDDKDMVLILASYLKEIGMSVETLSEGTHLLATLEKFRPQLLLLDIALPNYDGWTLLKLLRHDSHFETLKIVVITGTQDKMHVDAHQGLFDEIWYKPIDKVTFQANAQRLLAGGGVTREEDIHLLSVFKPRHEFENMLTTLISMRNGAIKRDYILVFIKSLDYSKIDEKSVRDKFLVESENFLNRLMPKECLKGYLGNGFFGLFFGAMPQKAIEEAMHTFLDQSEYRIRTQGVGQEFATFSVLLLEFDATASSLSVSELIDFGLSYFSKTTMLGSEVRAATFSS